MLSSASSIRDRRPTNIVERKPVTSSLAVERTRDQLSTPEGVRGTFSGFRESVGRCYSDVAVTGCAHLLMSAGFAITLLWIAVLWVGVRVIHRRHPRLHQCPQQQQLRHLQTAFGRCVCARRRPPSTSGFSRLPTSQFFDDSKCTDIYLRLLVELGVNNMKSRCKPRCTDMKIRSGVVFLM